MDANLHQLDPTGRFTDRARDYALYRPGYAAAAMSAVMEGLGDVDRLVAADIGAGTGISARLLAERGVRVVAIEPNAAMRSSALPHPRIEWRDATAEATGLDDGSVHLIICAQAFHWFEPERALAEFARILRNGGRLALLWNEGNRSDPLTAAYYEHVNRAAESAEILKVRGAPEAFWSSARFANKRELAFEHAQDVDEEALVGRALSASYVPRSGPGRDELERALRQAYRRLTPNGGRLVYNTRVYLAERA